MHDQTRAWMWRWGLTLLGMWLLGGTFVWAQGLGKAQLELMPPHPTPSDRLVIRLFGQWRNSCVPKNPQLSITGSEVRIETTNPGKICLQAITPWELFVAVEQLSIGAYQVLVLHMAGNGPSQPIGQADFTVQPIAGCDAQLIRPAAPSCRATPWNDPTPTLALGPSTPRVSAGPVPPTQGSTNRTHVEPIYRGGSGGETTVMDA